MFKNAMLYRIAAGWPATPALLEERLQAQRFVPCARLQDKSVGWVAPRGQAHGALLEVVAGQWILELQIETKVLPASVVRRRVQEQVDQIAASTGRTPGKKERRDLTDDARTALLAQAFTKLGQVRVWVDPRAGLLVTDAASQAKADEVMTWLIRAVDGLSVHALDTHISPAVAMAHWLTGVADAGALHVEQECELSASDASRSVVRYTRHRLDIAEVHAHIAQGKLPRRLALTWLDRVALVLTETLQLKRLRFLEGVLDDADAGPADGAQDRFDTDVVLATGELRRVIADLLEVLGGEVAPGAPAAAV